MTDHDINNNPYLPPPAPIFQKTAKPLVCYPTLNELEKNIPPPGLTPAGSSSDLLLASCEDENDTGLDMPSPLVVSSSSGSHTDVSVTSFRGKSVSTPENEVPLLKPVLVIPKSNSARKKSPSLSLVSKDTNSNIIISEDAESVSTHEKNPGPPTPYPSTTKGDAQEDSHVELDIWERIGKTCTPISARRRPRFSSTLSRSRRPYVVNTVNSDTETASLVGSVRSSGSAASSIGTSGIWSVAPPRIRADRHDINNNYYDDTSSLQRYSSMDQYPSKQKYMLRARSTPARDPPQKHTYPHLKSVLKELKEKEVVFDRFAAIQALKTRVLRGDKVTHEEISAIRNMTLPPHQRHMGWRLPWSKDLCCIKGLVHIPTPNRPAPARNTFGKIDDLRLPTEEITEEHWGRRQYVLNLAGFHDDDISLYLEGRNRLVIRAVRPDNRNDRLPPATVTETIVLPPDLPADNLRIVRKPSGTTIIEESWRF